MELNEIFKKLKTLNPREEYTERSRSVLLRTIEKPAFSFRGLVVQSFEFGTSLALAGGLILLVLGGISLWKFISPIQLGSLDPAGLRVEAQAIDMQIQLTNLSYQESSSTAVVESTKSTAIKNQELENLVKAQAKSLGLPSSTSSPQGVTIDQALKALSE